MKKPFNSFFQKATNAKIWAVAGFLALGSASQVAEAQVAVAIGAKAGLAVTSFRAGDASIESRTSALGGLFLNWQIHPILAVQPEVLITQRGAAYTKNNVRTDIRLNYFEVPVLLKLRAPIGDVFFPHVLVGPNFAFNTNAKYTSVDNGQNGNNISTSSNDVTKTDVGGLVGLGFDIQANHLFFTMDGRYGYSFNKVGSGDVYDVSNTGWTFSAGIGFRFGGGSGL